MRLVTSSFKFINFEGELVVGSVYIRRRLGTHSRSEFFKHWKRKYTFA